MSRSSAEIRYWVSPVDDPDALGDHGGYTFVTRKEAEDFVEEYYEDEQRLVDEGYYESHHEISLLMIETMRVEHCQIVEVEQ